MNFNAQLLRPVRILLFPFSLIYALLVITRNKLYDKGYLHAAYFNFPLICVGNLSVGGTGKSTMVEYLLELFKNRYKAAVLSRGYKRKTKGYALANNKTTALEIGDEPMQFHLKYPEATIAVGEERVVAIPQLLHDRPDTQVILLDDAFQHRSIKAGLNILLTQYAHPFTKDWFLPTGDLRDEYNSYKRAEILLVTKCPASMEHKEKDEWMAELEPLSGQEVYFSSLVYKDPYHILSRKEQKLEKNSTVLLVSGIANPSPLKQYLNERVQQVEVLLYNDHHIFTIDDWKEIKNRFEKLAGSPLIITTEKDAVRLVKFSNEIRELPLFVLPIGMHFLFNEEEQFNKRILSFMGEFQKTKNE